MTKKKQIQDSLDQFIAENTANYNGIIPLNEMEYSINGIKFLYESPYWNNTYQNNVCWTHFRDNYYRVRVRDLSLKEYKRTKSKLHGNLLVVLV